jgi:DNA replication protein DnaC
MLGWRGLKKTRERSSPRLGPFKPIIDEMLRLDLDAPRKQRHTAKRIFVRLVDERGVTTYNESFSGWTKTFTDPRLCAAIVDRLTFNGTIIETGTNSYRLAHARQHTHG